jgi:RND family efflux transporter MFP subunit
MNSRNLLITGLVMALGACGPSGEEAQPSQTQDTRFSLPSSAIAVAKMQTVRPAFEFPGLTEAIQSTETRAMVSAEIKALHFTPGQMVNQGDLLVEFDPADYVAQYAVAEAKVKTAKAAETQARSNWERAKELKPDGYISEMQFEETRAIYDTSRAAVASAEADLQRASLDLERTKVYAPFSGKISRPHYAVGTYVVSQSAVQPQPLFELVQLDPIYVKGALELGAYNRAVLLRQRLASEGKEIPELALTLELAGNQEYPYSGTFESWDNTSVSSMGTITARLQFPNPDGLLLPGQNVLVKGESIDAIDRIVIPQKAVQIDQQGHFVMAVAEGDVVQRRNIEVGIRVQDQWSVQRGLVEGERIAVDGLQTLREGMILNIQDTD